MTRIGREIDRISFSRLLNSAYKRVLNLVYRDRFFVASYYGCRFLVRMGDLVGRDIARNRADFEQIRYLLEWSSRMKPSVFIDIGAHAGLYTCAAMIAGIPRAIAFEPDRRNAATLSANLMMNGLIDRVDVRQIAIGKENEQRHLVPGPSAQTGLSKLSHGIDGYMVDVARLDDAVDFSDECIAIKIDVEGLEFDALDGMLCTLQDNKVLIQIESAQEDRLTEYMAAINYHKTAKFNFDHVFENL